MNLKKSVPLLLYLLYFNTITHTGSKAIVTLASVGISTAMIYTFYHLWRTPEKFNPSIDNLNTLTIRHTDKVDPNKPQLTVNQLVKKIHQNKTPQQTNIIINNPQPKKLLVEKGLTITPNDPTIFILSRGYARTNKYGTNNNFIQKGGCAMAAYMPIADNVINYAPCITFDYPDRRRCFNFAQKTDFDCLKIIYDQTIQANPNAQIILMGDCRGTKTVLSLAATQPDNLKAMVLFSPFISTRELTQQIARNYLNWMPHSSDFLYGLLKLYFPNYDETKDDIIMNSLSNIKKDLPIFIAHRKNDLLIADSQIDNLVRYLRETGHTKVHFIAVNDTSAPHSKLTPNTKVQHAVNEFFYTYGFPYQKDLKIKVASQRAL
ncbi:MAG: alpha/beta fold hydrolase [bacterium]|nr:alpha/beta fold hydrolase [bacterium]